MPDAPFSANAAELLNETSSGRRFLRNSAVAALMLHDLLPESTSIHFHGLELPNAQDGVPFITPPPVKPGQDHAYEFTVPNAGSHTYHSHHDSAKQVGLGLLRAFIVEPAENTAHDDPDVDQLFILNDSAHGYTFNGESCHILPHAESDHGMFGMVTALVVQK